MAERHIFPLACGVSLNHDGGDIWIFLCWVRFGSFQCEFTGGAKKERFLQEVQGRQNCFSSASEWKSARNVQELEYSLYFHSTVIIFLTMWFQKPLGSFSPSSHWLMAGTVWTDICLILHVVSPKIPHQRRLLLWPHLDRPQPQFKNDSKATVKVWCATSR